MPEEAPAEQVPDDVPEAEEGAARESAPRHAQKLSRSATERDRAWERPPERSSEADTDDRS